MPTEIQESDKQNETADIVFTPVEFDSKVGLVDLIAQGKFGSGPYHSGVAADINEKTFPPSEAELTSAKLEMGVLQAERKDVFFEEILKKLDEQGLRPATVRELISFVIQFPDRLGKDVLVALGSEWRRQLDMGTLYGYPMVSTNIYYPDSDNPVYERQLSLILGRKFNPNSQFLVVKKGGDFDG